MDFQPQSLRRGDTEMGREGERKMLAHTEREDRHIWSVKEYLSSRGNFLLASNGFIAAAMGN